MADDASQITPRSAICHFLFCFDKHAYASPEEAADALLHRLSREGYSVVDTLKLIVNEPNARRKDAMWKEIGP